MVISYFQPVTFPSGVDVICPTCNGKMSSPNTIMLLLVTSRCSIVGAIADKEIVCCESNIISPKLFADCSDAVSFANRIVNDNNWQLLCIMRTKPDILEMFDAINMPISTLEEAIKESMDTKMTANWELLRQ